MKPNYSTPFALWLKRPLTPKEEAFIDFLERQRCRLGRVRVMVHDPYRELVRVISEYVAWHQVALSRRDALIFTPNKLYTSSLTLNPSRCHVASARSYSKHYGKPLCIGQAVLFGADAYCPSVPLWRNYFDQIFRVASGYISGPGTVFIIHGNINTRRPRRSRFARVYEQRQQSSVDPFLTYDASVEPQRAKVCSKRSEESPLPPQFLILNPQFLILPHAPRAPAA